MLYRRIRFWHNIGTELPFPRKSPPAIITTVKKFTKQPFQSGTAVFLSKGGDYNPIKENPTDYKKRPWGSKLYQHDGIYFRRRADAGIYP